MLLWSTTAYTQPEINEESNKFKFGFNLGTNFSTLIHKPYNQSNLSLPNNAEISNGIGLSLGLIMDYSITDKLTISPKSEMSFYNSSVVFIDNDNSNNIYEIFPTSLNFMTHFVYKIKNNNIIPYLLIGPNFKLPISRKPYSNKEFYNSSDLAIDLGIGLENKTKVLIFAPELKYSFGLLNINQNPLLQRLYHHNISLIINFK